MTEAENRKPKIGEQLVSANELARMANMPISVLDRLMGAGRVVPEFWAGNHKYFRADAARKIATELRQ